MLVVEKLKEKAYLIMNVSMSVSGKGELMVNRKSLKIERVEA